MDPFPLSQGLPALTEVITLGRTLTKRAADVPARPLLEAWWLQAAASPRIVKSRYGPVWRGGWVNGWT